ncbi:MAG: hypothetical protein AB1611_09035 [bacterium]
MTQTEILEELKKLTPPERLTIIEAALHLIREDLLYAEPPRPSQRGNDNCPQRLKRYCRTIQQIRN